jgi:hypothetical protein
LLNKDFRPISYAWVGENPDEGLTVQSYYEENSIEEAQSSAPNIVNLQLRLSEPYQNGTEIPFLSLDDDDWDNNIYNDTNLGYKWCVAQWGDENIEDWGETEQERDLYLLNLLNSFPSNPSLYIEESEQKQHFNWIDFRNNGGLGTLTHQYQEDGLFEIKIFMFSFAPSIDQNKLIQDLLQDNNAKAIQTYHWKLFKVKINLNLSDVFIEDFTEVGGIDFKFLPMKKSTPVIGGLSKNSDYVKTLNAIVDSNLFLETEYLDKIRAKKALANDNFGDWPGSMDLEQVRIFNKPFDMNYLLGVTDDIVVTPNRLRLYDNKSHWDGIEYSFSDKTSIGEIFIGDNIDVNLKSACILELNVTDRMGNKILDSSGNSNIGILIGDYTLTKNDLGEEIRRQSALKTPKSDDKDGAI